MHIFLKYVKTSAEASKIVCQKCAALFQMSALSFKAILEIVFRWEGKFKDPLLIYKNLQKYWKIVGFKIYWNVNNHSIKIN